MIGRGHSTLCTPWDRLGSWTISGGQFSQSSPSSLLAGPSVAGRTERAEKEGVCEFKMYAVFERVSKSILVFKDKMHGWEHHCSDLVLAALSSPSDVCVLSVLTRDLSAARHLP